MTVELKIPEVGESVTEAFVQSWLKKEGEYAEKDEPVAELETEKVSFELPAPVSGTISKITHQQGDTAKVNESIGQMEEGAAPEKEKGGETSGGDAAAAEPSAESSSAGESQPSGAASQSSAESAQPAQPSSQPQQPAGGVETEPRIMPAARRALAEHGLSADEVEPTGPGGRLLKEDVMRHVARRGGGSDGRGAEAAPQQRHETGAAAPSAPRAAAGDRQEEAVPMSPMRKTIARRLVEAKQNAALLTTFNEVDLAEVQTLRKRYRDSFEKKYGIRLGFMSFFVKAAVEGLKRFPAINAEIRENQIVYRNYYDIGIAVSTEKGLTVPVIRSAERLSFADIELAVADFGKRAQNNQLQLHELEGGTFTITNGGVFGSLLSTPIVNPPQSGVLGMHTIQDRPVARDGQVVIRPMMYTALTYDHRIVDGREAVSFLRTIKEQLEDPARLLLEI